MSVLSPSKVMSNGSCHVHNVHTNKMRVIYGTKSYTISIRQSGNASKKTYGGVFVPVFEREARV